MKDCHENRHSFATLVSRISFVDPKIWQRVLPAWSVVGVYDVSQEVVLLFGRDAAVESEDDRSLGVLSVLLDFGDGVQAVRFVEVVIEEDRIEPGFLDRLGQFEAIFYESDIFEVEIVEQLFDGALVDGATFGHKNGGR